MNTVSLVDNWPSTLIRSNDRFTVTPVRRSAVPADIAASVWTKQNVVAYRGEIIPAPLAWAVSFTVPFGSSTDRHARFGPRSLVRSACENSERRRRGAPRPRGRPRAACRAAARCRSRRWMRRRPARARHGGARRRGAASGRRLETTLAVAGVGPARVRDDRPQALELCLAGGDHRRSDARVGRNRAADTVSPARSETSTPTSSPSGFRAAATPAARKPLGSPVGSSSVTCSGFSIQRDRSIFNRSPPPRKPEHQVEVLNRLRRGALPEVVDHCEHDDPAGPFVAVHRDPAHVCFADIPDPGRRRRQLDELLRRVALPNSASRSARTAHAGGHVTGHELALVERQ